MPTLCQLDTSKTSLHNLPGKHPELAASNGNTIGIIADIKNVQLTFRTFFSGSAQGITIPQ
jgi:hypothetical protein